MTSFNSYILQGVYEDDVKEFDRLARFDSLIEWEAFRPITASSCHNLTENGGRPNIDCTVMLKLLVLQQWYGLSDPPEFQQLVAFGVAGYRCYRSHDNRRLQKEMEAEIPPPLFSTTLPGHIGPDKT